MTLSLLRHAGSPLSSELRSVTAGCTSAKQIARLQNSNSSGEHQLKMVPVSLTGTKPCSRNLISSIREYRRIIRAIAETDNVMLPQSSIAIYKNVSWEIKLKLFRRSRLEIPLASLNSVKRAEFLP